MNKELTLEEAENIVDNMYQNRWKECGVEEGNTIHMGNLSNLKYNELESASILLLRTEIRLQQENKKLNGAIQTYDILLKANVEENKQLKDDWNKLKKWLEKELGDRTNPNKDKWLTGVYDAYRETIDKMQEIQGSDSNE